MTEKTCCFTGHRAIRSDDAEGVKRRLRETLVSLIDNGYDTFVAGGAVGFDTIAAETVLALKRDYPHIKLHLVLPCLDQDSPWSPKQKNTYRLILKSADSVEYVSEEYTPDCMRRRNYKMADLSSVCVAYWDGRFKSGTYMTLSYAKKKGARIINVYK